MSQVQSSRFRGMLRVIPGRGRLEDAAAGMRCRKTAAPDKNRRGAESLIYQSLGARRINGHEEERVAENRISF